MASTKASSDLNKTWTLLPEEGEDEGQQAAAEEEEGERDNDHEMESVPDDEVSKMSFMQAYDAQMTFSQINSHSMLLDEQAPMGLNNITNNTNRYSLNVTTTINSPTPANATIVKSSNQRSNNCMNLTVTCLSGSSTNSSPSSNLHRLSSASGEFNRFNDDMQQLFLKRFQFIDAIKCDSLFEETITGLEFENGDPICASNPSSPKLGRSSTTGVKSLNRTISLEKPTDTNKLDDDDENLTKKSVTKESLPVVSGSKPHQQQVISLTNSTSSLSSSLDNIDDRLVANVVDEYDLLPLDQFEARSVPKTFDMFLNDLKKSSSSLDINRAGVTKSTALIDTNQTTADDMRLRSSTATLTTATTTTTRQFAMPKFDFNRILTSSVDKDLNLIKKPATVTTAVEPTSNLTAMRKSKLNRTIDLEKPNSITSSTSSATSSTSSSSSFLVDAQEANAHNFKLPEVLPLEPDSAPTNEVFNSTYTYSLDPDQVEMDFLQQKKHEEQLITRQHQLNHEDMNNNSNKNDDLNRTKDIITNDDNDELNKTRDLTDRNGGADRFKTLVKRPIAAANTGIVPPASRISSIYKSKLPSTTTTTTTTTAGSSQIKQPEVNKIPRPTSIVKPTLTTAAVTQAQPASKLSSIPRVGARVGPGIKSPTVKSPSNGKQSALVRPTVAAPPPSSQTSTTNLNRLSSTSTSSSSSSSSSLKENKKSPVNNPTLSNFLTKQVSMPNTGFGQQQTLSTGGGGKSPGGGVSKITAFNNNPNIMNINSAVPAPVMSKLRPPTQVTAPPTATTALVMNKINDPAKMVPNKNVTNQMSVDLASQKQIAKPSMIPSLKNSSSIPMFRNTTNSQIKKL